MKKIVLAFAALIVWLARCAPASAFWLSGGANESRGTQNYNGLNAYVQAGGDAVSLKPMFESFHSDVSGGTFNTYSLRLGYDTKILGLGLTGGATPSVNGYNNKFAAVDATVSLTPSGEGARERINGRPQAQGPAQGAGLARIDIGGTVTGIQHTDHLSTAGRDLGTAEHLGQADFTGSAGVALLTSLLSVDVTKSMYSRNPGDLSQRSPRVQDVVGLAQVVQGYPDTSVNVKVLFGLLPVVKPYVGYTHTTFLGGVPGSHAYTAGLAVALGMLQVSANWEHYTQSGQTGHDFFGLGAGLRF